ncbi:MAG: hypothetical protein JEY97_04350 [Bacteroidales bacterium]|nr:hypothetical protein [Bacteroidales bacterium]
MKKIMKLTLVLAFVSSLFFIGCSDKKNDEPQPEKQDRFEVLKNYLSNQNLDLNDILTDWLTTAENVYNTMMDTDPSNDYYIIDIRSADDYEEGHIKWAVNSTLGGILEKAQDAGGKPIIVVCYSGQSAGHGVVALRLSGYTNAKVMMWGMCSWNAETAGSWNSNTGDAAVGSSSWMIPYNINENTTHAAPELMYDATATGAQVLEAQVAKLLEGGFKGISGTDVLSNPLGYFTNNYWALADVEKYGNIKEAYRIQPLTLENNEYLNLDANQEIVTYCWTGQTSSLITAYLNVLGYNAYSLKFGANSLIYSNLEAHNWSATQIMGYPLVKSQTENRFEVLKTYLINQNLDLNDVLTDWITTAENVYNTMMDADPSNDYYIIDIRSADDYTGGHIEWAVNSTLGGILDEAHNADGKPIIVVCYSGQSAGHGVVALRLSGYTNAKVMMWGMCSWNAETAGSWNSNTGDAAIGNANWMLPYDIKENTTHTAPSLMYDVAAGGAEILEAQVAKLLEGGFKGVSGVDVLDNPTGYFTNNYWALSDVEQYGNIKDAYRIQPLTLENNEYLNLDAGSDVVTYCWTGQTSSIITAYLTVLGYNAKSLKFGANSLIHSNLESHDWGDSQIMGYPLSQ